MSPQLWQQTSPVIFQASQGVRITFRIPGHPLSHQDRWLPIQQLPWSCLQQQQQSDQSHGNAVSWSCRAFRWLHTNHHHSCMASVQTRRHQTQTASPKVDWLRAESFNCAAEQVDAQKLSIFSSNMNPQDIFSDQLMSISKLLLIHQTAFTTMSKLGDLKLRRRNLQKIEWIWLIVYRASVGGKLEDQVFKWIYNYVYDTFNLAVESWNVKIGFDSI